MQIEPSKPSFVVGNHNEKMNALTVYALRLHARMSQELILCIAPHMGGECPHIFFPVNIPHDKLIRNTIQTY